MNVEYIREQLKTLVNFLNLEQVAPLWGKVRVNISGVEGFYILHDGKQWVVQENG